MIFDVFSLDTPVRQTLSLIFSQMFFLDIWVGLPGTIENLDYLARDYFDATSNHDRKGQKVLLKRALEEAEKILEDKDQKKFDCISGIHFH